MARSSRCKPDSISCYMARAAITLSVLDLEVIFSALKCRCTSEDRISNRKAAEIDPLQAHDRLHGVQLANQIFVLVITQLSI